jgi:hypothetical protein
MGLWLLFSTVAMAAQLHIIVHYDTPTEYNYDMPTFTTQFIGNQFTEMITAIEEFSQSKMSLGFSQHAFAFWF